MKKVIMLISLVMLLLPLSAQADVVDSKSSTVSVSFIDSGEMTASSTEINDTTHNLTVTNNENIKIFASSALPTELSVVDPDDITIEETEDNTFVIKRHATTILINDIAKQIADVSSIDITNENQTPVHYTIVNGP